MKQSYKGPAEPIPTHRELISDRAERISDRAERIIFLLLAIVAAVILYLE